MCEDEVEVVDEPQEDDYVTSDHNTFYQYGKPVIKLGVNATIPDMWEALDEHMAENKWFPSCWFISDHGNAHLMERP
jgi:hypothetical protein